MTSIGDLIRSTALDGMAKHADAIRSLMRYQLLAIGLLALAFIVSQHELRSTHAKYAGSSKFLSESESLKRLHDTWRLDSSRFTTADDYIKNHVNPALSLAFVHTIVIAGRQHPDANATTDRIGNFAQQLNRYAQSLRQLAFAAGRGATIDELSLAELQDYARFLAFEEQSDAWSKDLGALCRLSVALLGATERIDKTAKLSDLHDFLSTRKTQATLKWGVSQLIALGPGVEQHVTLVEAMKRDDYMEALKKLDRTVSYFESFRDISPALPYAMKGQQEASAADVEELEKKLQAANFSTLGAMRKQVDDDRHQFDRLKNGGRLPLFSSGVEVPLALVGWLLPLTNLALFALAWSHRRQLIGLRDELGLTGEESWKLARGWLYNPFAPTHPATRRRWSSAVTDGIGLFGLSIVAVVAALFVGFDLPYSLMLWWALPLILLFAVLVGLAVHRFWVVPGKTSNAAPAA